MLNDPDAWRAAAILFKHHGQQAQSVVEQRLRDLEDDNDEAGVWTWQRIGMALTDLLRDTPSDGESVM